MRAPAVRRGRQRGLFVTRGGFSHINAKIKAALESVRPDLDLDTFDVASATRSDYPFLLRCLIGVLREYGVSSLRSKAVLRYRLARSRTYLREVRKLLDRRFGDRSYAFTLQTQSLFSAARDDCPHFIYTDHAARAREDGDGQDDTGRPSDAWFEGEGDIYASAEHVFTFGPRIRDLLVRRYGIPPDAASAIGAGASVMPTRPVETGPDRYAKRRILFVGVEWARKGGPDLVAAFQKLRKTQPDATLTIVGCSPDIAVEGVRVVGRLPLDEVENHFHAASCFCMPSRLEPFGVVYVEAFQFALPVVATDVSDVAAIVRDGETGRIVPPGDVDALAEALCDVLERPERCRSMGLASLDRAHLFTWEAVARRIAGHLPGAPAGMDDMAGPFA